MAKFKWTVEFEVDEVWVADGFVLTSERALDMLSSDLGWADISSELSARVVSHPDLESVAKAQGYRNKAHMLAGDAVLAKALSE